MRLSCFIAGDDRIKTRPLRCCCVMLNASCCSEALRWKSSGFCHMMKTLRGSAGDGATQAAGPADVMGETGRARAPGLVTRAPLSFTLKLQPDTCCHVMNGPASVRPPGLKPAHRPPTTAGDGNPRTGYGLSAANTHQHDAPQVTHTHTNKHIQTHTHTHTH